MPTRRPLYKRPRRPARIRCALEDLPPPSALPDASPHEVASAIYAAASSLETPNGQPYPIIVGRTVDYDPGRDIYTVTAKNMVTGKATDYKLEGEPIAFLIELVRQVNRGPRDTQRLVRGGGFGIQHEIPKGWKPE